MITAERILEIRTLLVALPDNPATGEHGKHAITGESIIVIRAALTDLLTARDEADRLVVRQFES